MLCGSFLCIVNLTYCRLAVSVHLPKELKEKKLIVPTEAVGWIAGKEMQPQFLPPQEYPFERR